MAMQATLAAAPLVPGADDQVNKTRAQIAQALLLQSMENTPVRHWTQGLGRIAQALSGGYELGQLEREGSAEDAERRQILSPIVGVPANAPAPAALSPNNVPPAAIRYNNPGAQWPGPSSQRFGATGAATIGGGNQIAQFPDATSGGAAQFDLLNRQYSGMPLSAAIAKWSGGNSAPQYVQNVTRQTGLSPDTVITPELLKSPQGIQLAQAMAQHEAGRPYPMSPEQWQQAQGRAFGQQQPIGPAASRATVDIPPEISAAAQMALNSRFKGNQMIGTSLLQQYMKPREADYVAPSAAEKAARGIPPTDTTAYQLNRATNKMEAVNPQPFMVNVNQQQESEFRKKAGSLQAERFNDLAAEGRGAQQMMSDISTLQELGDQIRTGKMAEVKGAIGPYADALGINIKGLSEIQAYDAIINRMAPQLRVKGTGAQSDFELRNFMKSLSPLGATPEGNTIIRTTLTGMYQNKLRAAEIGANALSGSITPSEAEKQIRELPDPMADWRKAYKALPKTTTATAPAKKQWAVEEIQ